jgi:hypothetical protein
MASQSVTEAMNFIGSQIHLDIPSVSKVVPTQDSPSRAALIYTQETRLYQ